MYNQHRILNCNDIYWYANNKRDIVLIRIWWCHKDNHITKSRGMEKIGPLIYEYQFLVMQAGFHTCALDIEVLHSKADDQKHQNRKDNRLNDLTYKAIPLLKIEFWIHSHSFPGIQVGR